jgi:FdhE protein
LAQRYPASAEPLLTAAEAFAIADALSPVWEDLPALQTRIRGAIASIAPAPIRDAMPVEAGLYFHEPDPLEPGSWVTRIALEAWARSAPLQIEHPQPNECPRCGHAPQLGILRTSGHGNALWLACSLCRHEWPFRRGTCPQCGISAPERIDFYSLHDRPHVRAQVCQQCRTYFYLLAPESELALIPEVDELALLDFDEWAAGQQWQKIWPNLAGV